MRIRLPPKKPIDDAPYLNMCQICEAAQYGEHVPEDRVHAENVSAGPRVERGKTGIVQPLAAE